MASTRFADRVGVRHPIIQAPMAGGGDTPELVAAVANAGGLGVIGAAYLTPEQIMLAVQRTRQNTERPFGINLFAPVPFDASVDTHAARARVAPYYEAFGIAAPEHLLPTPGALDAQIDAVLASGASCLTSTFGLLPARAIAAAKAQSMVVMATATTVEEAIAVEESGADFVIAQGSEAGGHRGSFAAPFESAMVGTIALVPQIVDAVSIPVIASGGIMDGRGIAAALMLGACAAQLGTAFLTTDEAGISSAYKRAILAAHDDDTRITRAFSGRPARGIVNRFMDEFEADAGPGDILPFPLHNALTRGLRSAAAAAGRAEFLSLWAGQGTRMARRVSAAALIEALLAETSAALAAAGEWRI